MQLKFIQSKDIPVNWSVNPVKRTLLECILTVGLLIGMAATVTFCTKLYLFLLQCAYFYTLKMQFIIILISFIDVFKWKKITLITVTFLEVQISCYLPLNNEIVNTFIALTACFIKPLRLIIRLLNVNIKVQGLK